MLVEDVDDVEHLDVRDPSRVGVVTQTTLSVDDTADVLEALKRRYPTLATPRKEDICYATQNRQDAVKALAQDVDVVIVVGSRNSSNSNRLREVAMQHGVRAHLVDGAADIDAAWLAGAAHVGVTAGASAPEILVRDVVARLRELGAAAVSELDGAAERVVFALPKDLPAPRGVAAQPRE